MSELELIDIFAGNLRTALEHARMSQAELADAVRLSEPTISRYLRGERLPSVKAIVNICHVLDLDFEDLIPTYDLIE